MFAAAAKRTALAAASVLAVLGLSVLVPAGGASSAPDDQAPTAPLNLRVVSATPSAVSIAWDASSDDVGVEGYLVLDETLKHPLQKPLATVDKPAYVVTGLSCGQSAPVGVVAFDKAGNRSEEIALTVAATACLDTQPPSAPTGFTQLATSQDAVVLGWSPASDDVGVVSYGVYRDLQRVATPADPTIALSGLTCGSTVPYAVDAVDAAGNRSLRTDVYVRTAPCSQPQTKPQAQSPAQPQTQTQTQTATSTTTTASGDGWTFCAAEWNRCVFSGTKEVRYGVTGSFTAPRTFTDGVDCQNAVFGDPAKGTTKHCEVRDVSAGAPAPPPPPPSPSDWTFCANEHQRCAFSGAKDVRYGVTGTFTSPRTFTDGVSCSNDVFGDPVKGTVKYCEMRATSASSSPPPPTPPADTTPPSVPAGLGVAGATVTTIALSWKPSTDNVAVTGYRTYVDGAYSSTTTQLGATIQGLRCGSAHTLEVDAVDAQQNASARASVIGSTSACVDTQPPSTPTGVTATSRTATSIALSWTPSSDNVGVVGYGLYRDGSQAGTASAASTILTGLACNTNYTLAVDAYDGNGNRSQRSVPLMVSTTACPDTTPPSTPTGLASSNVTQTTLSLSWKPSTDDVQVAGYNVYRDGVKVASPAASPSAQSALSCGTSYSFAVEAFDAAGNRSARASLGVSTSACPTAPSWTFCSNEHQRCAFTGAQQVRYGANATFTSAKAFTDGVDCENSVFGDPLPTVVKHCEILSSTSGSPPPPPPAPAPPTATSGPITITSGGTYTGNWQSTSSTPAITIATSQPVTIVNSIVKNLAGGTLINAVPGGSVQVTVQNTQAYGGGSAQTSGRFFVAENFKSVSIRNCSIENTLGIELDSGASGSSVVITRNRHHNIQGNGTTPVGNFVQFRSVQNSSIDVSWNEVTNDYGSSDPEDLISLYQSANANVHDNYFFGQSTPGNAYGSSSQNGITIESGTQPGSASNNTISNNQLIAGEAIGMFSGNNNMFQGNRIVRSGYLTDGVTMNRNGYEGLWISTNGSNNHAHGNVVGYVNRDGVRSDGRLPGAPEGDSGEWANNTHMPGTITLAVERNEWNIWQQKLSANGISIGASTSTAS